MLITSEGEFVLPLNVVGILGLVMEVEVVCIVGVSLAANVQVVLTVVMASWWHVWQQFRYL